MFYMLSIFQSWQGSSSEFEMWKGFLSKKTSLIIPEKYQLESRQNFKTYSKSLKCKYFGPKHGPNLKKLSIVRRSIIEKINSRS